MDTRRRHRAPQRYSDPGIEIKIARERAVVNARRRIAQKRHEQQQEVTVAMRDRVFADLVAKSLAWEIQSAFLRHDYVSRSWTPEYQVWVRPECVTPQHDADKWVKEVDLELLSSRLSAIENWANAFVESETVAKAHAMGNVNVQVLLAPGVPRARVCADIIMFK